MSEANFYEQVYAVVRQIPRGKVTSYGRIARMLGRVRAARAVGYALNALKDNNEHDVPWQRVVNAQGRVSIVNRDHTANEQAIRLREEGIALTDELKIVDFEAVLWDGLPLPELERIIGRH